MKTMINIMENTVSIFFFLYVLVSMVDAKRRDRFDIIEKRIGGVETRTSIIESRINSDNELAKLLQQNFEELNNSLINFKDQMCPIQHQQTEKEEQTSSTKRVQLLKSSRILVSLGLNREKQWTRDQVEKFTSLVYEQTDLLNQNFSKLKNELKDEKHEMESILEMINETINDKIQANLSNLDEIITNNVKDINEVSLKSDTTEKLISVQQREIEALKEIQTKLLNVLVSANLINLEKLINFEHLVNYDFTCPSDWTNYSSYCYLYVGERKTFSEARDHCKGLEATVSDIENEAENTFNERLIKSRTFGSWIGYSDEMEEGSWISERTGQPASFTNFRTDQLQGRTGQNCALMWHRLWYDYQCGNKFPFICKKDAKIDFKM